MKILIDRNIERHAITHNTVFVSKTIDWCGREFESNVVERRRFNTNSPFIESELPYFATICEMARSGLIAFYTSFELNIERIRQRNPRDGYCSYSLLTDIDLIDIDPPAWKHTHFSGHYRTSFNATEADQMEFFDKLDEPRYSEIKKALGNTHIDDAFHLWNAEVASLDVFLTLDRKFHRHVAASKHRLASGVEVLLPSELCERLGKGPTDIEELASRYLSFR